MQCWISPIIHLSGKRSFLEKQDLVDTERDFPTFSDVKAAKEVIHMLMNKVNFGEVSPAHSCLFLILTWLSILVQAQHLMRPMHLLLNWAELHL